LIPLERKRKKKEKGKKKEKKLINVADVYMRMMSVCVCA